MDLKKASGGVEESKAGVVVVDDRLQGGDDAIEDGGDIASAHQKIIDFEEDAEAVAFEGKLLLIGLRGLKVDGIVDGNGHLSGNALHETKFDFGHALGDVPAKHQSAKAMLRGGERNDGDGVNTGILDTLHEIGVAHVLGSIERDEGLLILPDPTGGAGIHGQFGRRFGMGGVVGLEDMNAHGIARGVVENEAEKVELQDGVQPQGEFVKEALEVALLRDGFTHIEEGFQLAAGMLDGGRGLRVLRRIRRICHKIQDSTGFVRLTTAGER